MMARGRELILSLLAIVCITGLYLAVVAGSGIPVASGFVGHMLGVLGFVLMLMTELLYSLRMRAIRRPRGSMRAWLQFHIFTGIVGAYLVILHSAWTFQGLAGVLTLMTLIVVASGFVGRYIYTAVPRTADGVVLEAQVVQAQLAEAQARLEQLTATAGEPERGAEGEAVRQARRRLRALERQLQAMRWARRMLATWHTVHIPLGMVLFVTAFVHIGAALYYATLLR
jgi:hypothetical protein